MSVGGLPLFLPFPNNHVALILLTKYHISQIYFLLSVPITILIITHMLTANVLKAFSLVHFKPFSISLPELSAHSPTFNWLYHWLLISDSKLATSSGKGCNIHCRLYLIWPCLLLALFLPAVCLEWYTPTGDYMYNSLYKLYCFLPLCHCLYCSSSWNTFHLWNIIYERAGTYLKISRIIFYKFLLLAITSKFGLAIWPLYCYNILCLSLSLHFPECSTIIFLLLFPSFCLDLWNRKVIHFILLPLYSQCLE